VLTLPEIDSLERARDELSLHFVISGEVRYFDGHFPELSLLPGVVQIGWAVELARLHLAGSGDGTMEHFRSLATVKFVRVIQPGERVWLRLSLDRARRELHFEYRRGDETCSSGRVLFH
jgi:3-hydroxymyristoyl/3-hydroxydecanoyl-(acyl carrier protein) dehydratase